MQLLPATAKLMADNTTNKTAVGDCSGQLLDPSVNMALGQKYVRHLTDQLNGRPSGSVPDNDVHVSPKSVVLNT